MTGRRTVLIVLLTTVAAAGPAHADRVSYTLEDVILLDGRALTGAFDWTYTAGDFEGGSGEFTALEIPWRPSGTLPPLDEPGMVLSIENNQIEITLDSNFHDYGLDVSLKFVESLSPAQPSSIDLATSFFECCGNGFHDQPLIGGYIAPLDSDTDGVPDAVDNCLTVANADQRDTNGDGFGNRCDADFDGDCAVNAIDLSIMRLNFFGSMPDIDLDGDGVVNSSDLGIMKTLFFAAPGPSGTATCGA